MMKKRGQSAVELLSTYGWVLLAVLVTVGALVYFGVFDLNSFSQETCTITSQLVCEETLAFNRFVSTNFNSAVVLFSLRNNFGKDVTINMTANVLSGSPQILTCTNKNVLNGKIERFECNTTASAFYEGKIRININATFSQIESTSKHSAMGYATVKVRGDSESCIALGGFCSLSVCSTLNATYAGTRGCGNNCCIP